MSLPILFFLQQTQESSRGKLYAIDIYVMYSSYTSILQIKLFYFMSGTSLCEFPQRISPLQYPAYFLIHTNHCL